VGPNLSATPKRWRAASTSVADAAALSATTQGKSRQRFGDDVAGRFESRLPDDPVHGPHSEREARADPSQRLLLSVSSRTASRYGA